MKITQTVVLVVGLVLSSAASQNSTEVIPQRCGSCWCIPDKNGTCPSYTPGIAAQFSPSVYAAYSTFNLLSTPLTLATSSGDSNCYPFADTIGSGGLQSYAESTYSQCAAPNSTNETVCAYKFQSYNVTCSERGYDLNTYSSSQAAEIDKASVVHSGACGVCSHADDLSVHMQLIETISSKAFLCGTAFVLEGGDFSKLQSCFTTLGFTSSCALLWAHYTATISLACSSTCTFGANLSSSGPPNCDLPPCLNCSIPYAAEVRKLGGLGISVANAGIVDENPRPCSTFTRITHDPCAGATAFNGTEVPRSTSTAYHHQTSFGQTLVFGLALGLLLIMQLSAT